MTSGIFITNLEQISHIVLVDNFEQINIDWIYPGNYSGNECNIFGHKN